MKLFSCCPQFRRFRSAWRAVLVRVWSVARCGASVFGVLLASGCATYLVRVETVREHGAPALPTRYFLDLAHTADLARAPQFPPALQALRAALRQRGFTETARREEAEVVVEFGFGARPGKVSLTPGTRTTEVRSGEQPLLNNGRPTGPLPVSRDVMLVQQREVSYVCWLHVAASEAATGRALWQVEASAEIGAADRNAILPCLVAAAQPLLDPDASAVRQVAIGQASAEVRALREG
jgi:hypothetical protein